MIISAKNSTTNAPQELDATSNALHTMEQTPPASRSSVMTMGLAVTATDAGAYTSSVNLLRYAPDKTILVKLGAAVGTHATVDMAVEVAVAGTTWHSLGNYSGLGTVMAKGVNVPANTTVYRYYPVSLKTDHMRMKFTCTSGTLTTDAYVIVGE